MSPSPAGFNPFSSAMSRMTSGSGGGGFIAEQRRMQFALGMTHLQHQLGMQRDAVQHEYDQGMAKVQGKQARKTLKAQNAAAMERDTHQSGLKINEAWEAVDQTKKREQNAANVRLSEEKRRGQLPPTRQEKYQAAQQRRRDDLDIAGKELDLQRSKDISAREANKIEAADRREAQMQPMMDRVMGSLFAGGSPSASGSFQAQPVTGGSSFTGEPAQERKNLAQSVMPRYGSGSVSRTAPRRLRRP